MRPKQSRNTKSACPDLIGVSIRRVFGEIQYRAMIRLNGKDHILGVFKTPREAALAYDNVARDAYGSKAVLNFP